MNTATAPKPAGPFVALLCFAVLASLAAIRTEDSTAITIGLVAGPFLGFVLLKILGWLISLFNPQLSQKFGKKTIYWIVNRSFLLLLPFTVLALIATLVLGWEAATAFASAGIMTSSTAIGAELSRLGGGKIRSILLPAAGAIAITAIWMLAISGIIAELV